MAEGKSRARQIIDDGVGKLQEAPIIGGFFGGGGKGAEKAAQGARDVANRYNYLARDSKVMWDDGTNTGLGMYQPSQDLWSRTYGQNTPGAMEQFYGRYGSQFQDPTATSGALKQYQEGMGTTGGNLTMAGVSAMNAINQPSLQRDFYSSYGSQLAHPGRTNQAYADSAEAYKKPGAQEDWASTLGDTFSRMNAGVERRNAEAYAQLQNEGRTEQFKPETVSRMGALANSIGKMQGTAQVETASPELQRYYRGASDTSDYYGSQQRALQAPGAYEQFVTNDIYGRNPAHERAMNEGLATVNQQMARRGAFNSGAAMTGIGNFVGKMEAEDYQNRSNRAAQAQQMQMGRIGQGTQTAQASAQGKLAQGSALQGLAGQRDTEKDRRLDQFIGVNQAASGEQLASQRLGLDAATAADQSRMARLKLGSDVNMQGADAQRQSLGLQNSIYGDSQQFGMDRAGASVRDAGAADQAQLARLMGGFNMSQSADSDALRRAQMGYDVNQGMHDSELARYGQLGHFAGQQDQQTLARLMGMGQMAGAAQSGQQDRYGNQFDSQFGINSAMAQLYANMFGGGMNQWGGYMDSGLNALANSYGLQGQAIQDRQEAPWRNVNAVIGGIRAAG
jgi:hypothetical protein